MKKVLSFKRMYIWHEMGGWGGVNGTSLGPQKIHHGLRFFSS